MKRDYCETCDYADKCEYAYSVRFCRDCKDYRDCSLRLYGGSCYAGYDIECDNGFEEENEYDDEVE